MRVLVDAPEFLIAHDLGVGGSLAYFGAVILLVPAAFAALSSIGGRWGRRLRVAVVAVLGMLAVAGIAQPISWVTGIFWFVVLAGGVGLAVVERRWEVVRSTCALLSVLALLLGAWVVGPSRVGRYVRSGNQPAVSAPLVRSDTPVVVVVFDEFSMVPVLDGDLRIDRDKFPNLSALAGTSTWFRMASSTSPQTSSSVPALLSGVRADADKIPVASDYPTNLFRLLARSHDVAGYEPITALCGAPCETGQRPAAEPSVSNADLISDTGVVLRQAIGSEDMRAELPSISQGWAGFADASESADAGAGGPKEGGYGTFFAQSEDLVRTMRAEPILDRPALRIAHIVAPHLPWVAMPDASVHSGGQPQGLTQPGSVLTWGDDEGLRRAGYQQYLFQLGALDRTIGEMRRALEGVGLWDDALVVVTADHGLQFQPGTLRNVRDGGVEVTNVPLFVKRPGQTQGRIDDRAALTMDIVPTILGQLGAGPVAGLDGKDLFHDRLPSSRPKAFLALPDDRVTPDQRKRSLRRAVDRRATWIDPDGGWDAVYQAGVDEPLVGRRFDALGPATEQGRWERTPGEQGRRISFTVSGAAGAATYLAICDGTIAGATPINPAASALVVFASHEHCDDPSTATVGYLDAQGRPHRLGAPA